MNPVKNIYSSNENMFSLRRNMFVNQSIIQNKQTFDTQKEKKFYGNSNNRDSSSIVAKRAVDGNRSSFPINGQIVSHQGATTGNDSRQALKRVRSSGSTVPPIKTHKYKNAPIFY